MLAQTRSRIVRQGTSVGNCAYLIRSRDEEMENPLLTWLTKIVGRGVASICFLSVCASPPIATAQATTIRAQSSLVLVDVFSQDRNSGLPVRDFKKEDFRLFDNRHEVSCERKRDECIVDEEEANVRPH